MPCGSARDRGKVLGKTTKPKAGGKAEGKVRRMVSALGGLFKRKHVPVKVPTSFFHNLPTHEIIAKNEVAVERESLKTVEAIKVAEANEVNEAAEVLRPEKSLLRTSESFRHLNSALLLCFEKKKSG